VIPRFPVYLFDVDGTLLDSAADICGAIVEVLGPTGAKPVGIDYLKGFVGTHLKETFAHVLPHYTPEQIDELILQYRACYPARGHKLTSVYPGVREGLEALGGRKSTATIKGSASTRAILEQFGLVQHFEHVQGTDGFPGKPAPDVIYAALAGLGAKPGDCLMVGDSPGDMEAGRRAGVRICGVRYGYGDQNRMARFEPDYWVDDLRELAG
jgi:phosphoglycolate phosphatase